MVFSSIPFLYYFLPVAMALYFLVPAQGRTGVLFLESLVRPSDMLAPDVLLAGEKQDALEKMLAGGQCALCAGNAWLL